MKNYYDLIWSDAIQRGRLHNPDDKNWKFRISFYISFLEGIILSMTLTWLKKFSIYEVEQIYIDFCRYDKVNYAISYFVMYVVPFFVLNYFLIFFRNRYEKIVKKYPMNKVEYMMKFAYFTFYYFIISMAAFSLVGNGRFIGD